MPLLEVWIYPKEGAEHMREPERHIARGDTTVAARQAANGIVRDQLLGNDDAKTVEVWEQTEEGKTLLISEDAQAFREKLEAD